MVKCLRAWGRKAAIIFSLSIFGPQFGGFVLWFDEFSALN
jgi:hypothetical protein